MCVHMCFPAHLTFMFSQPFDMEITKPHRQYQRNSTLGCQQQTCNSETSLHKHARTHTLFPLVKRASFCLIPCEVYLLSPNVNTRC